MNVLLLNGSPKCEKSNTLKLSKAFIEGMSEAGDYEVEIIDVYKKNISSCTGCFSCWNITPGQCVLHDDMDELLEKYISADIIIMSFPNYYFSVPSKMKAFIDRLLPLNLPFIESSSDGGALHPPRYDLSHQKYVVISTCGFFTTKNNFEGIEHQFNNMYRNHGSYTKIFCPQGELFRVEQLREHTERYLDIVRQGGREYGKSFLISEATYEGLASPLFPTEQFIKMADASWGIVDDRVKKDGDFDGTDVSALKAHNFMLQMSAIYNPEKFSGDSIILEYYFTDLDERYQMVLTKDSAELKYKDFAEYTTRIETPFTVWQDISKGKMTGEQALFDKLYKVKGQFNVMLSLTDYFMPPGRKVSASKPEKTPNMFMLMAPWIVLWILGPVHSIMGMIIGSSVSIALSFLLPVVLYKAEITKYDRISFGLSGILSLLAILGYINPLYLIVLSYLLFAGIWGYSLFTKIPITAIYVCKRYGGEKAFNNPLFIKTNRIISAVWVIAYVISCALAVFMFTSLPEAYANYAGIPSGILSAMAGIFTAIFSKWYPENYTS